ncbi:nuclear transport factor 2 family protein [Myxococcota bacterium]|nr:nuclear transport factor 2 family protein [Myxococcota bacterium]
MPEPDISKVLERYTACVTAGDVDGIVGLYASEATLEIPVGGSVSRGIDAIRAFYAENELAERLVLTGTVRVAGREAAAPMCAHIRRDGQLHEVDVIDVVAFDDEGRLTSMRAFFDLAGMRPLA